MYVIICLYCILIIEVFMIVFFYLKIVQSSCLKLFFTMLRHGCERTIIVFMLYNIYAYITIKLTLIHIHRIRIATVLTHCNLSI